LALAYILHLYESHWLYILKENLVKFSELRSLECKGTTNSKVWSQKLRVCNTDSYIWSLISKIWRFLHLFWYSSCLAPTTFWILLIIATCLWLISDKYLLYLNTILDISIKSARLLEPCYSWLGSHCSARLECILRYLT